MWSGTDAADVLGAGLLLAAALLSLAAATTRRSRDVYDPEYEEFYPTLFSRDHREFFVSVDHRHLYCDCSIHRQRVNVSAQARVGAESTSQLVPIVPGNNTDVMSVIQLGDVHTDELASIDALDSDRSEMTSSRQRQQLLYVVLPVVITTILLVIVITAVIISLLRRRLRYVDKSSSSEQESVNLTSFAASQPQPITGLQLCAAQQHQLLLDTMSIHRPRDVIVGDDQSRAADKQAPASISAGDSTCLCPDWTYDSCTPARKEVTVKCYLDTSSVRAVLTPKTARQ